MLPGVVFFEKSLVDVFRGALRSVFDLEILVALVLRKISD